MLYLNILSAVIASSAIVSNVVVCVLFLGNKVWLEKPYNVFILCLAVTDMITGLLMFITPGMIFEEPIKIPNSSFLGVLYCKGLWSRWSLFALGAVSVYTCLVLTIERWTAICRPFHYRRRFSSRRLIGYIVLVWVVGIVVSSMVANETTYHLPSFNSTKPRCSITPLIKGDLIGVVSAISVGLKFLLPAVVILVMYAIAIVKFKGNTDFHFADYRTKAIKNITKMAATASIALVVCWLPNQIYFILHKFRLVDLFTVFHNITTLVVFLNSTLNPFIYAFWSKNFRSAIKTALCHCRRRRGSKKVTNAKFGPPEVNYRLNSYTITSFHPVRDGIYNNGQIISFNNVGHDTQNVTDGASPIKQDPKRSSHMIGEQQERIEDV